MKHAKTLITAIAVAGLIAMPSHAGATDAPKQKEVSIAGYDLTTDEGAEMVLIKIEQAAERVCDFSTSRRDLKSVQFEKKCVAEAVANAVTALDAPRVSEIYTSKLG